MQPSDFTNIKEKIREALREELPGEKAHRLLLPQGRDLHPISENTLQSSVLMLLFPLKGQLNTTLIRRPSVMRNHGGQIAFPGGRYEPSDADLIQTALRESVEEIGIDSSQVEILGALTPLYVQVSNFMIHPFVGWCNTLPSFNIANEEVEEQFIIPIQKFTEHADPKIHIVNSTHGAIEAPGFYIGQLFIWGATAMIISEFNEIYNSRGFGTEIS